MASDRTAAEAVMSYLAMVEYTAGRPVLLAASPDGRELPDLDLRSARSVLRDHAPASRMLLCDPDTYGALADPVELRLAQIVESGAPAPPAPPMPDPLPFAASYIAWGNGAFIEVAAGDDSASRMMLQQRASADGLPTDTALMLGHLLAAGHVYALAALFDGARPHLYWTLLHTPARGWLDSMRPDAWMLAGIVRRINACATRMALATHEAKRLKRRLLDLHAHRRPRPPPEFYRVEIAAQYLDPIKLPPQPRDWSHRWDVRGHWTWRTARGLEPLDPALGRQLARRGYRIFDATHPCDAETRDFLRAHKLPPMQSGEWLAALRSWRRDHVKGPDNLPYIPSVHAIRTR